MDWGCCRAVREIPEIPPLGLIAVCTECGRAETIERNGTLRATTEGDISRLPPKVPKRLTYGPEVCDWIEEYCVLPTGDNIGEPFILMDWQREWIYELFRTDKAGTLQYRWALLGVPKGNGKSPLAAALGLYHLLGDPDVNDPWVVVSAASDKQANIVFDAAKRMCELSPSLNARTERFRWEIQVKDGPGKLERVAASGGKLDGKLVSMLIMDELHEWTLENWVVLTGGAMKRRGSQIIQITTAGWDKESICYREYAKGMALQASPHENPTYFFKWYSAPEHLPFDSLEAMKIGNPSFGTLVFEDILRDLSKNIPQSQYERYRNNRWVDSEEFWLPYGAWEACADPAAELTPGAPTYVGWDASTRNDSTGVVALQEHDGVMTVKAKVWARDVRPDGNPDESWLLPIAEVENYIRELCRTYDVREVSYDPAFITWSAADLEAEGLPMISLAQSPARMCPPTAALYEAVVNKKIRHNGDKVLAAHIHAAHARPMRAGGVMLEKSKASRKIDAAVALVMAVASLMNAEPADEMSVSWASDD